MKKPAPNGVPVTPGIPPAATAATSLPPANELREFKLQRFSIILFFNETNFTVRAVSD